MDTVMEQWATQWQIPPAALEDLRARLRVLDFGSPRKRTGAGSEAEASKLVQMEASRAGIRLWRNNNGAAWDRDGRLVRYGLGNVSKAVSAVTKSSDLIGCRPRIIEQGHVGCRFGQFVAREMKPPGWIYSGTDREAAQLNFLTLVFELGGDACFATGPGTL